MSKGRTREAAEEDGLAAALHELRLSDDAAALRAFIDLCGRSPRVRQWVASRIGSDELRNRFIARIVRGEKDSGLWGTAIGDEVEAVAPDGPRTAGPFGGLSEVQIWRLIKACQGGDADAALFVVTQTWHAALADDRPLPASLWLPTLKCWRDLVADRSTKKAQAFVKLLKLLDGRSKPADESWRIHVLLYILRHPQPCYRVGELYDSLPERFRRPRANGNPFVERREVRKFCAECGIRRDTRAGARPRARV